jgi:hypothetical protein
MIQWFRWILLVVDNTDTPVVVVAINVEDTT